MAVDYVWRFAATRLNGRILALLDRRSTARKVTFALGKAAFASGTVAADNPAVNIVQADDFPILAEGVRNIYGFRKEGSAPAWVCRFGGRLLQIQDNVEESQGAAPYSNWTAYDPRQLLYTRPVLLEDGTLIGKNGLTYEAGDGIGPSQIALDFLQRSIDFQGDVGILTTGGTVESTLATDISFEQGTTVGEAWDLLEQSGYVDIILTPTYDPTNPGALAIFNAYEMAGTTKYKAIFAWDQPGRSLVAVDRMVDGSQRANKIRYYAGQGGPVSDVGTVSDSLSLATYGEYWAQQFFPSSPIKGVVGDLARSALLVRRNGVTTWRVTPAPAQATVKAPVPLLGYGLGDIVPIYVSSRLREEAAVLQRVIEIPLDLRDDGTETVSQLSFSADGLGGVGTVETSEEGDPGGGEGVDPGGGGGGLALYEKLWEDNLVNSEGWGAQAKNFGTADSSLIQRGNVFAECDGDPDTGTCNGRFVLPADTSRRQAAELLHPRYADPGVTDFYSVAVRMSSYDFPEMSLCQFNYQGISGAPLHLSASNYLSESDQAADKQHASIHLLVNSGNVADHSGTPPYYSGQPRGGGGFGTGYKSRGVPTAGPYYLFEDDSFDLADWLEMIVQVDWTFSLDGRVRGWSRIQGAGAFVEMFDITGAFPTLQWNTTAGITTSSLSSYWTNDKHGAYRQQASSAITVRHDSWRRTNTYADAEAVFA